MGTAIIIILSLALYFLPLFVAIANNHRQIAAIGVLNILLGWTVIGWVIAAVWAFTTPQPPVVIAQPTYSPLAAPDRTHADDADDIERFARLRDDGLITAQEFEAKKRAILG